MGIQILLVILDLPFSLPDNSQDEPREEVYTQCYGPGCTRASRSNSKYCSDDCGLRLATNRLYELLPQRIQQWQSSR